jgi:methyl-accepting chemotaxis protein
VQLLSQGQGDLTTELPVRGDDEIGQLAKGINKLTGKLREIIADLYRQAEFTAVAVCKVDRETARTVSAATDQKEQSTSVAVASEEMAATLNDVAANTQRAAQLSSQVNGAAGVGMAAVGETFTCMEIISDTVVDTLKTVEGLAASSSTISEITTLIEDIADQINLANSSYFRIGVRRLLADAVERGNVAETCRGGRAGLLHSR